MYGLGRNDKNQNEKFDSHQMRLKFGTLLRHKRSKF